MPGLFGYVACSLFTRNMIATGALAVVLGLAVAVLLTLCLPGLPAVLVVLGAAAILALGGGPALAATAAAAAGVGIWLYRQRF